MARVACVAAGRPALGGAGRAGRRGAHRIGSGAGGEGAGGAGAAGGGADLHRGLDTRVDSDPEPDSGADGRSFRERVLGRARGTGSDHGSAALRSALRRRRLAAAAARRAVRAIPGARRARGAAGGRRARPRVLLGAGEDPRMSQRRFGLRLRLAAILTGAGLLCAALLSVALLLRVRDEIARRHVATVRDGVTGGPDPLLAEGGDLLGRLAPAVNRLDARLREERSRVRAHIAELERSNAELRRAREEVARSERLASVGRLAAGVAHEVGNPMTALMGFLGILGDRMRQGKGPGDYLERSMREAERIDRILRDLLDLARPPPRQLQRVDLRTAAESARGLVLGQAAWTGCEVEGRLPSDLPAASADDHYVVQVLVNLMMNASRAGARRIRLWGGAAE